MAHQGDRLSPGTSLHHGNYIIECILGQGGFGITYLATDVGLDKSVAIKELFPKNSGHRSSFSDEITPANEQAAILMQQLNERFRKEAQNIARLDHPNIVKIHTAFEQNNTAYFVMEYIEGYSLHEKIKQYGPLPLPLAFRYLKGIADALSYMHGYNINHLDVKPSNIMVRLSDDSPVLIDFGLSKRFKTEGLQTTDSQNGISHGYAPIEQYDAGGINSFSPQTDIYSLAATFYYLVTGFTPPQAVQLVERPLTFPQSFPPILVPVIQKAMAVSRNNRYDTVEAFMSDLLNGLNGKAPKHAGQSKSHHNFDNERTQIMPGNNGAHNTGRPVQNEATQFVPYPTSPVSRPPQQSPYQQRPYQPQRQGNVPPVPQPPMPPQQQESPYQQRPYQPQRQGNVPPVPQPPMPLHQQPYQQQSYQQQGPRNVPPLPSTPESLCPQQSPYQQVNNVPPMPPAPKVYPMPHSADDGPMTPPAPIEPPVAPPVPQPEPESVHNEVPQMPQAPAVSTTPIAPAAPVVPPGPQPEPESMHNEVPQMPQAPPVSTTPMAPPTPVVPPIPQPEPESVHNEVPSTPEVPETPHPLQPAQEDKSEDKFIPTDKVDSEPISEPVNEEPIAPTVKSDPSPIVPPEDNLSSANEADDRTSMPEVSHFVSSTATEAVVNAAHVTPISDQSKDKIDEEEFVQPSDSQNDGSIQSTDSTKEEPVQAANAQIEEPVQLQNNSDETSVVQTTAEPTSPAIYYNADESNNTDFDSDTRILESQSENKSKKGLIIGIVVGIIVLGIAALFFLQSGDKKSEKNSATINSTENTVTHAEEKTAESADPNHTDGMTIKDNSLGEFYYVGDLKNGVPNGNGKANWEKGKQYGFISYEGEWQNGVISGKGKCELSDGTTFEGTLKNNKFVEGIQTSQADGLKYEGTFDKNQQMLNGTLTDIKSGESVKIVNGK